MSPNFWKKKKQQTNAKRDSFVTLESSYPGKLFDICLESEMAVNSADPGQ